MMKRPGVVLRAGSGMVELRVRTAGVVEDIELVIIWFWSMSLVWLGPRRVSLSL